MPKLRQSKPDFAQLGRLLRGYGASGASIARAIGCAPTTGKKKLDEPKYLTVGDLAKLSAEFGIPMDEIRSAMVM
jgi:antitoxin component HigA of HigAB toxin-antitoxin module